jgi:hypothetical protein
MNCMYNTNKNNHMNIELLGRQAISILKSRYELPTSGLLAGGSLGNIIWELVSGNKAIINDIDIFVLNDIITYEDIGKKSLFEYKEEETNYHEEYSGMSWSSKTKDYYRIVEARKDDINNIIDYISSTDDPFIVINSFDINCTKVGYSLENDKFYWTDDFVQFLQTGELKISNLKTPAHTALRLVKKSKELNAKLEDFELNIIQHVILYEFSDVLRYRFKDRYFDIFELHKDKLQNFFEIEQDLDIENYIKIQFNDDSKIWRLKTKLDKESKKENDIKFLVENNLIFNDNNLNSINKVDEFLFYMRKIYNNDKIKAIWSKLKWYINDIEYFDIDFLEEDLELLHRLSIYAPMTINNLRGHKMSEQLEIVKRLLDKYKDDPIIAISILEKVKIDKDIVLDEETSLLLELSVRKQIVNDTRGKVSKILENESNKVI